jgi:tetratricopeptide (TPR) repeat protein
MSNETPNVAPDSSLQFDLLSWYELNKRSVFGGFALIVVAIGAAIVYRHYSASRLENASRDLLLLHAARGPSNSLDTAQLLAVASRHSGTPAADQASLIAGRELFIAGNYAEARTQFDRLASSRGILGVIALYGVAACTDAEKGGTDALNAYQAVIAHPDGAVYAGQARLAKARLHETLQQPKEAVTLYDELIRSQDRSLANDAFIRRAALLRSHPELDTPAALTNSINITPGAINLSPTPSLNQ